MRDELINSYKEFQYYITRPVHKGMVMKDEDFDNLTDTEIAAMLSTLILALHRIHSTPEPETIDRVWVIRYENVEDSDDTFVRAIAASEDAAIMFLSSKPSRTMDVKVHPMSTNRMKKVSVKVYRYLGSRHTASINAEKLVR